MEDDKRDEEVMVELSGSIELEIDQSSNTILIFDRVGELTINVVDKLGEVKLSELNFVIFGSFSFKDHQLLVQQNTSEINDEVRHWDDTKRRKVVVKLLVNCHELYFVVIVRI
jgi:hypothetical protein